MTQYRYCLQAVIQLLGSVAGVTATYNTDSTTAIKYQQTEEEDRVRREYVCLKYVYNIYLYILHPYPYHITIYGYNGSMIACIKELPIHHWSISFTLR